jgi:hypothetical protein
MALATEQEGKTTTLKLNRPILGVRQICSQQAKCQMSGLRSTVERLHLEMPRVTHLYSLYPYMGQIPWNPLPPSFHSTIAWIPGASSLQIPAPDVGVSIARNQGEGMGYGAQAGHRQMAPLPGFEAEVRHMPRPSPADGQSTVLGLFWVMSFILVVTHIF